MDDLKQVTKTLQHYQDAIKAILPQCRGSLADTKRAATGLAELEKVDHQFAAASESTAMKRRTGNALGRAPCMTHRATTTRRAWTSRSRSWSRRSPASSRARRRTIRSAFKSKWVRWKEKNQETRASKLCKDETLNVSVLENIAKLFPEGARRKCQPMRNARSCNLTRGQGRDPQLDLLLPLEHGEVRPRGRPSGTCRLISSSASASPSRIGSAQTRAE